MRQKHKQCGKFNIRLCEMERQAFYIASNASAVGDNIQIKKQNKTAKFDENLARSIVLFTNHGAIVVWANEIPSKENFFTIANNYFLLGNTVIVNCRPIP